MVPPDRGSCRDANDVSQSNAAAPNKQEENQMPRRSSQSVSGYRHQDGEASNDAGGEQSEFNYKAKFSANLTKLGALMNDEKNNFQNGSGSTRNVSQNDMPQGFKCDIGNCTRTFPSNRALRTHQGKCHSTIVYHSCGICSASLNGMDELRQHVRCLRASDEILHRSS